LGYNRRPDSWQRILIDTIGAIMATDFPVEVEQ
jgi:hypothetical protein